MVSIVILGIMVVFGRVAGLRAAWGGVCGVWWRVCGRRGIGVWWRVCGGIYPYYAMDAHGCHRYPHDGPRARRNRIAVEERSEVKKEKAQERGSEAEGRKGQYVIYY